MAESKEKLVLGYWGIQGLAQPTRYLLAYHKIDFEDKHYKYPEQKADWFEKDKPALKTDFPNLPYIKDGDVVVTESLALLVYAASKTGNKDLCGKNSLDSIKIFQLYSFANDFRAALRSLAAEKEYEKIRDQVLEEKVKPFVEKLSKNLGEKEYPLGYLTWADFAVFNALDILRRMKPGFLAPWPNLEKYFDRINNDGVQAYRKSENYPKLLGSPEFCTWTGEEK